MCSWRVRIQIARIQDQYAREPAEGRKGRTVLAPAYACAFLGLISASAAGDSDVPPLQCMTNWVSVQGLEAGLGRYACGRTG